MAILLIIALIVNIILVATNNARTVPFYDDYPNQYYQGTTTAPIGTTFVDAAATTATVIATSTATVPATTYTNYVHNSSAFNGSRILLYIVAGIMIALLVS